MRTIFTLVAAAGLLTFTACDSREVEKTSTSTTALEDAVNATDIAETTASPVDTQGILLDTLSRDSIK